MGSGKLTTEKLTPSTGSRKARPSQEEIANMMIRLFLLFALFGFSLCQEKPRLGKDGRPLLNKPKLDLRKKRSFHEKYNGHHYFLSWRESWTKFEDWDWFNARNYCRERCMDLVSFETPEEYRHFALMLHRDNISRSTSTDGSGLMETRESHRPTSQASSHFGAG